jgi:ceramide glucosyltransferase
VRWAKLRRATFPIFFLPEVLSGSCAPLLAAACAAEVWDVSGVGVAVALGTVWYSCEAILARSAGWHMTALSPLAWAARDLMLPVLWVQAWLGNSFSWRGNDMHLADAVASN